MPEMVLLGDEALAMGAIDAGISAAYAYPGTPSSEIMEYLQASAPRYGDFAAEWCSNEKTAYEAAVGERIGRVIPRAADAAECWLTDGVENAMNKFNCPEER